jgi:hypothetical protein
MKPFLVFLLFILVIGCASSTKDIKSTGSSVSADKLDESFDPLMLNDDDIKFEKPDQPVQIPDPILLPDNNNEEVPILQENKLVDGFRIQIISTKEIESAARAKSIAVEQFEDLDVEFYLEFDSPYYKVRLGDFQTRADASSIREVIRSRGYPKAWIVKTKVWSNPGSTTLADTVQTTSPNFD